MNKMMKVNSNQSFLENISDLRLVRDMRVVIEFIFRVPGSQYTRRMGLFKERRPSLPAMNIKTEEVESDVVSLDREFVIKHQEPVGVDISVVMEDDSRYECLVRLQPCGDPSLYTIRLATNITTFPLKTSCTAR